MRAGNSSDNGVGSCRNFFRFKADMALAVFVEDLTVYHGKLYVLFAAAVNEVFDQIILRCMLGWWRSIITPDPPFCHRM